MVASRLQVNHQKVFELLFVVFLLGSCHFVGEGVKSVRFLRPLGEAGGPKRNLASRMSEPTRRFGRGIFGRVETAKGKFPCSGEHFIPRNLSYDSRKNVNLPKILC